MARLWRYADLRHVPLRTIVVTVAVVAAAYLAGQLIYKLRTILLLIVVAGFVAVLLNPVVVLLQRRVPRRGLAVTIVTLGALIVFAVVAYEFGNPLVNGITDLAGKLPGYVTSAEHGTGWIGHLATKYHVQAWVQKNAPKLVTYVESLSKPVLTVGKGAISLVIELFTIFVLVLLLLLEAPKMRKWLLGQMRPERAATVTRIGAEVSQSVTGYMLGNLLTSLIAGTVVFVTLLIVGVPFPLLWGLWVALVDFLPMIGGALAGHPDRPVRLLQPGLHGRGRHPGRVPGLHPDREPRPESGDHEPDGQDQPAAGPAGGAGRRRAGQPGRRAVRRLCRGAAGHPAGRGLAGAGPRGVAGYCSESPGRHRGRG